MPIPPNWRTDHLILLVGGNVLPNAVVASLLAESKTIISLIKTIDTDRTARRLITWLGERKINNKITLSSDVKEADAGSIAMEVIARLEAVPAVPEGTVGLNYTGGTKAMAAQAHRAVSEWWRTNRIGQPLPVFTYLDARNLKLCRDPDDPATGASSHNEPVHFDPLARMELTRDFLKLHEWTPRHPPSSVPILPLSAKALAQAYSNGYREAWDKWIVTQLISATRKRTGNGWDDALCCSNAPLGTICHHRRDCLESKKLKQVTVPLPTDEVQEVVNALKIELNLGDNMALPLICATEITEFNKKPKNLIRWLEGTWLESWTLQALQDITNCCDLHDVCMDIDVLTTNSSTTNFQLDAIAIQGYRLYAFSCCTDHDRSVLKLKLFEAVMRARQLGGDETRVALVCASEEGDTKTIELEVAQELDISGNHEPGIPNTKRTRVFGRKDLYELPRHFTEWMRLGK